MAKTTYSHAFFVGGLDEEFKVSRLDASPCWTREVIKADGNNRYKGDQGYNGLCAMFYKSFIDSMIEAEPKVQQRPKFLDDVHHYYYDVPDGKRKIAMDDIGYKFQVCKLHIFTFPCNVYFFAIETDDSGQELNTLTIGHSSLSRWAWQGDSEFTADAKRQLEITLMPLKELLPDGDLANLIHNGNKLKLFQTIQLDCNEPDDKLLYEIGTSCKIGCIDNTKDRYCPSSQYWTDIVRGNSVSTFRNWKGLALMDSFTMLGTVDSFDKDASNYLYFPLIYLRCLFEKTFCFNRNISYREDKERERPLSDEIADMEQFYFYNNISYNFQPELIYRAMAKGLGLKEERQEITEQIKERAKKTEEEKKKTKESNINLILILFSIFAIFSAVWDLCSMVGAALPCWNEPPRARIFGCLGVVAVAVAIYWILKIRKDNT